MLNADAMDEKRGVRKAAMERMIVSNPEIMMGKPVVAGTRITVEHILDELAGGSTVDELVADHPRLTHEGIAAALAFAASALRADVVYPVAA